jgi:aminoglycoside phosphotransferase (APT) family kinase protein
MNNPSGILKSDSAGGADALGPALLAFLRRSTGRADLRFAAAPARVSGGFETDIFRFALAGAPADLDGKLILRRLRPQQHPRQAKLEGAVQNALAGLGYPVPRAHVVECDPSVLGGAFLVMDEVAGEPLAKGLDLAVSGAGAGRLLRLLAEVPGKLAAMTALWAETHARLHALPPEPIAEALEQAGLPLVACSFEGRLTAMESAIANLGLGALQPVLGWLRVHRPAAPQRLALCHGDFHPLNILAEGGRVTGVIDWSNATLADPAFDLGSTEANLRTVPMGGPPAMRPVMRGLILYALRRYRSAYRRHRALDEVVVCYYTVFRCLAQLVGAASRRHGPAAGAHDSPESQRLLTALIHRLTGIVVQL